MKLFVLIGFGAVAAFSLALPRLCAQPVLPLVPPIEMAPPQLPEKPLREELRNLLMALAAEDFANFVRSGSDEFKAGITREVFKKLCDIVAPRVEQSNALVYFGTLKQGPYTIYLWKLSPKGAGDEIFGELSIKDGKVDGFHLR